MDYAALGKTIARVYDAALSPSNWNEVLNDVASTVGARGSVVMHVEPGYADVQEGGIYFNNLFQASDIAEYIERYSQQDRLDAVLKHPPLSIVHVSDILKNDPGFAKAPLNQLFKDRFGVWHRTASRLNDVESWLAMIVVHYDVARQGMTHGELTIFQALLPHVAKALDVNRPVRLLEARYRAVLDALDKILIGVGIVSSTGQVVVANRKLQQALESREILRRAPNGRLAAIDNSADAELSAAISSAAKASMGAGGTAETTVVVPRKHAGGALIEICPLTDSQNGLGNGFCGALLYVVDSTDDKPLVTKGLRRLFELSAAEDAVAALVAKGLNNSEIAERRCVSTETVKSQVASVLSKSACQNRYEFLRLLTRINLPIE